MPYIHKFKYCNEMLKAYENNVLAGELSYEIHDDKLKIDNFYAGCNDPDYHLGTEMILNLLSHIDVKIHCIHGTLSTEDAKTHYIELGTNNHKLVGWHKSIPFYANLTNYINNSKFILYDGIRDWNSDITEEYIKNPIKTIDKLILANNNCRFNIIIK